MKNNSVAVFSGMVATLVFFSGLAKSSETELKKAQTLFQSQVSSCAKDIVESEDYYTYEWKQIILFCNTTPIKHGYGWPPGFSPPTYEPPGLRQQYYQKLKKDGIE